MGHWWKLTRRGVNKKGTHRKRVDRKDNVSKELAESDCVDMSRIDLAISAPELRVTTR
jgi:hypothetical protein